jgi:hypothetical protein
VKYQDKAYSLKKSKKNEMISGFHRDDFNDVKDNKKKIIISNLLTFLMMCLMGKIYSIG